MKKIIILISVAMSFMLSSCVLGGAVEADNLEGTWVTYDTYLWGNSNGYIYYEFNSTSVDAFDGDHSGNYEIYKYDSNNYWGKNADTVESGSYETDFILGKISIRNSQGITRVLNYELTDSDLYLTDSGFWNSSQLHLKKIR